MTGLLPPPARCQCLAFRSSVASTQSLQPRVSVDPCPPHVLATTAAPTMAELSHVCAAHVKRSLFSPQAPLLPSPLSARMPAVQARVAVSFVLLAEHATRHALLCFTSLGSARRCASLQRHACRSASRGEDASSCPSTGSSPSTTVRSETAARSRRASPLSSLPHHLAWSQAPIPGLKPPVPEQFCRRCSPRSAMRAQELGWYDPLRKETNLNAPAIKKWLSVGAQPSETVEKLLKKAMIMDP